ncbi:MAG: TIGR03560 family F420-dependent LLM class oxidoreductase [Chloroflexota bacterium]|nr:MAG: TIGR03560 family F420-dependent LLM class oxidoreductase [Chloroflexota bacterium]
MSGIRPLRHGVFPGAVGMTWPELLAFWERADELGYSSCWMPDHFYAGVGDTERGCWEAWTVLSAVAIATRRIRVGTMVLGNMFRHPAVVANMAATLDHVSGGRLNLGIGAGWMQVEHDGYGIPLPPPRERLDRLDESLQVLKLLFTEKRATFDGRYFQLRDALCEPKPLQKPYPRLVVGGGGEKRTLRVVARHADEWNGEASPSQMRHKIAILHEHCREVGRDPNDIEIGVLLRTELEAEETYQSWVKFGSPFIAQERERLAADGYRDAELERQVRASVYTQFLPIDEERAAQRLNEYAAVGVSHFIVIYRAPYDYARLERFVERVMPNVRVPVEAG